MRGKLGTLFFAASLTVILGFGTVAALSGKLSDGKYKAVGLFSQTLSLVRSSYVEELSLDALEEGAVNGLVRTADPQGSWVPGPLTQEVRAYHKRPLPPFGMVLGMQSSYPVILEVLPGSAAAEAGLQPGELIERIGTQPVRARPFWRALTALERAEARKETLALDVIARDLSGKRPIRLQPGKQGDPAPQFTIREGVPVVRLPLVTHVQVAQLARLVPPDQGVLVVDLRGTALGNPEGAVEAAKVLVGGEVRLLLQDRSGATKTFAASGTPLGRKVVVCMDHTTSRVGEWLAFLLAQRGAATVGAETFGDTALRVPTAVAGGELWLAQHFLVNGKKEPLLGRGLNPTTPVRPSIEGDAILEKALELARAEQKAKAA